MLLLLLVRLKMYVIVEGLGVGGGDQCRDERRLSVVLVVGRRELDLVLEDRSELVADAARPQLVPAERQRDDEYVEDGDARDELTARGEYGELGRAVLDANEDARGEEQHERAREEHGEARRDQVQLARRVIEQECARRVVIRQPALQLRDEQQRVGQAHPRQYEEERLAAHLQLGHQAERAEHVGHRAEREAHRHRVQVHVAESDDHIKAPIVLLPRRHCRRWCWRCCRLRY